MLSHSVFSNQHPQRLSPVSQMQQTQPRRESANSQLDPMLGLKLHDLGFFPWLRGLALPLLLVLDSSPHSLHRARVADSMTLSLQRSHHPGPEAQPDPESRPSCCRGRGALVALWLLSVLLGLGLGLAGADPVGPEACPLPVACCGPGEIRAGPSTRALLTPGPADSLCPAEPAHWHPRLGSPAGGQGAGGGTPGGGAALAAGGRSKGPRRGGGVRRVREITRCRPLHHTKEPSCFWVAQPSFQPPAPSCPVSEPFRPFSLQPP